ncbi:hypothetical protein ACIP5Y_00070 [Nocardia sp. NPDC088792]|uniref:hypothetical protein n=1 Tax=Nocardia sp. NPDC088792 TaxID=3364332 RepID=UPI0037FCF2D9
MKLIDGVHRIRAVQSSGAHAIDAIFFDGDESQTSLLSVRLNSTHGLPRMLSDKKIAAQRILSDYLDWSNRRLAEVGYGENSSAGTMETI